MLFKNNQISLISHVSSGGGYFYNGGSQAVTPNGTYNTTVYMPGWVTVPLGAMYNPVFFISTVFAIHGDTYVPQGPASHGCIRIPMDHRRLLPQAAQDARHAGPRLRQAPVAEVAATRGEVGHIASARRSSLAG